MVHHSILLIHLAGSSESRKRYTLRLMCLEELKEYFSCSSGRDLKWVSRNPSKTVTADFNMRFWSKCNHGFTNRGCFHGAVLKAWYGFEEKRTHKAIDMQFFLQNVQNRIFKILKMLKCNKKLSRATCWINSKISTRDKSTTLMIFLFCYYCLSLSWCNYWRYFICVTPLLEKP